jgi:quinol monooxygenase YgiN
MAIECDRDPRFQELVSEFPLEPIADDHSYRIAIEVLDRLFTQDDRQTVGELEYFRALAILACDYECRHDAIDPDRMARVSAPRVDGRSTRRRMKTNLLSFASLLFFCWGAYRFASGAIDGGEKLYVVTHVDVIPPFTAAGRELLRQFAADSRKDAGAVRVEVFEELSRPNHSTVVEVWESRKAYDDHLAIGHSRAYRDKLQPMLGSPFDERLHRLTSGDGDH